MTAMLDVSAYLDRIGYSGSHEPTAETLCALHRAHMLAVPFENLDIGLGRPIVCDEESFLRKIIGERRGGFCYELNGAFAALLSALGFRVRLLSARVAGADGGYGLEFDHLALCVDLPAAPGAPCLADVGFGDSFVEPLLVEPNHEGSQIGRVYRLVAVESQSAVETERAFCMEVRAESKASPNIGMDETWKRQYSFTLQPRELSDFAPMCHYHQTSPESHFTRQRICSRATAEGRITLSDLKLIETRNGTRTERELAGDHEWRATLREMFMINLPG